MLFTSQAGDISSFDGGTIEVVRVDTGERKVVHKGGYYARYIATGHLLFVNKGALFAIPFDLGKLEVTGAQMPVLEGLETNAGEGSAQYAVSDTGLLTYLDNNSEVKPFTIVSVDRQGGSRPLWRTPASTARRASRPTGDGWRSRCCATRTGTSGSTTSSGTSPPGSRSARATTPIPSGLPTASGSPTRAR